MCTSMPGIIIILSFLCVLCVLMCEKVVYVCLSSVSNLVLDRASCSSPCAPDYSTFEFLEILLSLPPTSTLGCWDYGHRLLRLALS